MNKAKAILLVSALVLGLMDAQAQSVLNMRVRGAIAGFDGHELQVKTSDGRNLNIGVNGATKIKSVVALKPGDIKRNSFVGVTAVPKVPGGPLLAREVHIFAETQRGMGEGHYAWDLEPGSSMTNANVDAIANTVNGKELTLSYQGGRQKIIVPRGVPVVSFRPANKSVLKKGAQIFCVARQAADGSLTAQHISVGQKGMKPPM
ncbi:MAG: hypothetical protein HZB47_12475 [Nitrosomonadales bacterium]|nr:hypothetical protein [Nitrosomonadales bacterium]